MYRVIGRLRAGESYRVAAPLEGPPCARLPHDSKIGNIMKQDQMTTFIKIKSIQRQCRPYHLVTIRCTFKVGGTCGDLNNYINIKLSLRKSYSQK